MNLEALQLYCEVVRQQSFSKAARTLGISQSAASQAVAQIEGDLGLLLIDRSKRPFALTIEGERYYEGVKALLEGYERLTGELQASRLRVNGTVRVASIYSVGLPAMSHHVQQFKRLYPQAKVGLEYLRPDKVVEAVVTGSVDLGLISYPRPSRALSVTPLRTEKLVFVCLPQHRLAARVPAGPPAPDPWKPAAGLPRQRPAEPAKPVEPADLQDENFVAFDPDLAIRKAIDKALRRRKVRVNVVMEFDNIETIKQALLAGAGVSILPAPTVQREAEQGTLRVLPLNLPELVRPLGLIYRRRKPLTPAAMKFVELLKKPAEEAR